MNNNIKKMGVIGAGTMGAAIAAMGARTGLDVVLLDISKDAAGGRNKMAESGLERTLKGEMKGAGEKRIKAGVVTGNTEDNAPMLGDCDLIIEAVVEDLKIKQNIIQYIFKYAGKEAIVGTNTSNISIEAIAEGLPADCQSRFLGIHFFNPVRFMNLVEIIPHKSTSPGLIAETDDFLTSRFGKKTVVCKDTPGFIANRIGSMAANSVMNAAKEAGYSVVKADMLTGELVFRPRAGTFKLLDTVGVDIGLHTAEYMAKINVPEWEKPFRTVPDYLADMVKNGQLGNKADKGFYRKAKGPNGTERYFWDFINREYLPQEKLEIETLQAVGNIQGKAERLAAALFRNYAESGFLRRIVLEPLWLSLMCSGTICNHFTDIDVAMKNGYNWELGPFEQMDAMGAGRILEAMEAQGLKIPDWAKEKIAKDGCFYDVKQCVKSAYLNALDTRHPILMENDGAVLKDIGEGIACYTLKTKANTFSGEALKLMISAVDFVEKSKAFKGIVVRNYGPNFSVGANLADVAEATRTGAWDAFALFQIMTGRIKYAKKPVVAAVQGRCLGGGAEVLLHAAKVCAHLESYVGLVEAGVGLVPAGGGCKELLFRATGSFEYGQIETLVSNLDKVFLGIAQAKTSMSAHNAFEIGYLRRGDRIIANLDDLLYQAKQEAIRLYDGGYLPPVRESVMASGEVGYYHMMNIINNMKLGGYITEYEGVIGSEIARILSGGGALAGELINEEDILLLERNGFMALSQNEKTRERIDAVLAAGKPIRN